MSKKSAFEKEIGSIIKNLDRGLKIATDRLAKDRYHSASLYALISIEDAINALEKVRVKI
jgi:hypothetical protein